MKMFSKCLSMLIFLTFVKLIAATSLFRDELTYQEVRNNIFAAEESMRTGGNVYLNPKETKADAILLKLKNETIRRGIFESRSYLPSMHFFKAKSLIEQDPIFDILKKAPKGGVLHLHNSAAVSSEWVIKNLTYRDDMRLCTTKDGLKIFNVMYDAFNLHFIYYLHLKINNFYRDLHKLCADEPVSISATRTKAENIEEFDKNLEKLINLYTTQPEVDYPDANAVWTRFQNMFTTIRGILDYAPTYKAFHWRLLEEHYEDNVMYVELRASLCPIVDENGKTLNSEDVVEILFGIVEGFKKQHENFLGMKIIQAIHRSFNRSKIEEKMDKFVELQRKFPNFIIGFDLVGQEDLGVPLISFIEKLKDISQNGRFFFHAGETNFFNTEADVNILDAILMNTKRIGHGFSLFKHPVLWSAIKEKEIAVEINPISNQVLHLVQDLRNHPASFYVSENIPIVIGNDDPGFWNAKGVSFDYYYAFMDFTPADEGLQVLKQLAWNSLKYSAMTPKEKKNAAVVFKAEFDDFVDYILTKE
ncbi:CLUMA_CG002502, isoform A [Clunio marinus]|uniref:Adenosine deaminase n=1 Tax=Clunio marinus TaxID=568069 RepID=A0A1J1HN28_9DIPT|nr:CLUMA_CG002502, isoform A [Clunio marinus]